MKNFFYALVVYVHRRSSLGAAALFFLLGCGGPAPWSNYKTENYRDLTRKHLEWLTEGTADYEPFRFALIADTQIFIGDLKACIKYINASEDLAFTFLLGDLTEKSLRREFEWIARSLRRFHRPVLTVVGNHDGMTYGSGMYKEMFGPLSYSFTYNGVKFIAWNNNPYEWGYPDFPWLADEISSHPRAIIFAHQPPGMVERYKSANKKWQELYKKENLLGSFHGHTHSFYYREIYQKPVFVTQRMENCQYSIVEAIGNSELKIKKCQKSVCHAIN